MLALSRYTEPQFEAKLKKQAKNANHWRRENVSSFQRWVRLSYVKTSLNKDCSCSQHLQQHRKYTLKRVKCDFVHLGPILCHKNICTYFIQTLDKSWFYRCASLSNTRYWCIQWSKLVKLILYPPNDWKPSTTNDQRQHVGQNKTICLASLCVFMGHIFEFVLTTKQGQWFYHQGCRFGFRSGTDKIKSEVSKYKTKCKWMLFFWFIFTATRGSPHISSHSKILNLSSRLKKSALWSGGTAWH